MAREENVKLGHGQSASWDGDTLVIKGYQGDYIDIDAAAWDIVLDFYAERELHPTYYADPINDDTLVMWNTMHQASYSEPDLVLREGSGGGAEVAAFDDAAFAKLNDWIEATNPDWLLA